MNSQNETKTNFDPIQITRESRFEYILRSRKPPNKGQFVAQLSDEEDLNESAIKNEEANETKNQKEEKMEESQSQPNKISQTKEEKKPKTQNQLKTGPLGKKVVATISMEDEGEIDSENKNDEKEKEEEHENIKEDEIRDVVPPLSQTVSGLSFQKIPSEPSSSIKDSVETSRKESVEGNVKKVEPTTKRVSVSEATKKKVISRTSMPKPTSTQPEPEKTNEVSNSESQIKSFQENQIEKINDFSKIVIEKQTKNVENQPKIENEPEPSHQKSKKTRVQQQATKQNPIKNKFKQTYILDEQDQEMASDSGSDDSSSVISSNEQQPKMPSIAVKVHNNKQPLPGKGGRKKLPAHKTVQIIETESEKSAEEDQDLINQELTKQKAPVALDQLTQMKKWKSKETHMFCAFTMCSLILILSSCLWIFLFQILIRKNAYLGSIILYPPTLKTYHNEYTSFWNSFEANYDEFSGHSTMMENADNQVSKNFNRAVKDSGFAKEEIINDLKELKEYLKGKNQPNPMNARRLESVLRNTDGSRRLARTGNEHNSEKVNFIIDNFDTINQAARVIKKNSKETIEENTLIAAKVTNLHQKAFELIEVYGTFYTMTNRIWVTTNNIFHLFNKRGEQVINEVNSDHFSSISRVEHNVKLDPINNVFMSKVANYPEIRFEDHKDMFLICQISGMVNNENLDQLGNKFQFSLLSENEESVQADSEIWTLIDQKFQHYSKTQVLEVKQGTDVIYLNGKVKDDEIILKQIEEEVQRTTEILFTFVEVRCFRMESYMKIPVYEKNAIEN